MDLHWLVVPLGFPLCNSVTSAVEFAKSLTTEITELQRVSQRNLESPAPIVNLYPGARVALSRSALIC